MGLVTEREKRILAALRGPAGEVLRIIALQPLHPSSNPPAGELIAVPHSTTQGIASRAPAARAQADPR